MKYKKEISLKSSMAQQFRDRCRRDLSDSLSVILSASG